MELTDRFSPAMNKIVSAVSKAEANFDRLKSSASGLNANSTDAMASGLGKTSTAAEKAANGMSEFDRAANISPKPVGDKIAESLNQTRKTAATAGEAMTEFTEAASVSPKMSTAGMNSALDATLSKTHRARDGLGDLVKSASASPKFSMGQTINSGLTSIDEHLTKTSGMFKSMLGAQLIGNGITAGLGMIKNALAGLGSDLSEASATWQTFQGNMNNIGMPQAQINSTKKELQTFAQQTIYSASDMASTYSQLAAVGTKNTTQLVKGFGGLAAASAEPTQAMTTLSQQATQMAAKPKVAWEDFKLILEQTPAGVSAVAKTMGMSTSTMIKNVQDGKIATQDFFNAIAKTGTNANFTAMATKFKTVGQAVDGLKETITNKLQGAFDSASQKGIAAVSALSDKIADFDLDGLLQKFAAFGDGFKSTFAMADVQSAFVGVKMAIMDVVTALTGIKPGQSGLSTMQALGVAAGKGIEKAATAIQGFANWVSSLDPATIQDTAKGALALFAALKGYSLIGGIFANIKVGIFATLATGVAKFVGSWSPGTMKTVGASLAVLTIALKTVGPAIKIASAAAKGFKAAINIGKTISGVVKSLVAMATGQAATAATAAPAAAGETAVGSAAGASAASILSMGAALLMVGGAVVLAAAGMWILVQAALQLASGGWPAVGALTALVGVIALFAVGAAALGPALAVAGPGLLMFGGALLMISGAVLIAAAGITLLSVGLPTIAQYGTSAAGGLLALGGSMLVFGPAAILAGAGAVVLGAGLLVLSAAVLLTAVGITALSVGMLLLGTSTMLVGAGMTLLAITLPVIASTVLTVTAGFALMSVTMIALAPMTLLAAAAVTALSIGLIALGAGALVAGAGAAVLGAGLVVVAAGLGLVAVAATATGAGLVALGAGVRAVASAFVSAGSMIVSAISGAMRNVISAVRSGISSAVASAKSFGGSLVSVGSDLISGLVRGITSMAQRAVASVGKVVGGIVSKAKSLLKIGSPSRLFRQFGRWTLEGYNNGIDDRASKSADKMGTAMAGVVDAGSGMTIVGPTVISSNPEASVASDVASINAVKSPAMQVPGPQVVSSNPAASVAADVAAMNAANNANLKLATPMLESKTPGDILAAGFERAANAVGLIRSALTALPSSSTVGVVGQAMVPKQMPTGDVDNLDVPNGVGDGGDHPDPSGGDAPSSAPVGVTGGGNSYATTTSTSHVDNSVSIAPGAIVINGGNPDDAETIVAKIEAYLKQRQAAQL